MLPLLLGFAVLFLLLGGGRWLARMRTADLRALLGPALGIIGVVFTVLLLVSGRGPVAFAALAMFGPSLWQAWQRRHAGNAPGNVPPPGARGGAGGRSGNFGPMNRDEAFAVLGLRPGASEEEIRAAHRRLMRTAHPDTGGSDWLATRINQARDILIDT
jgi:DnaJ family protein C protein 19